MNTSKPMRASTPRTRTGCANCRQRRIKCDEEKPACQRCIRSGWACPGYHPQNLASDARQSATGSRLTQAKTASSTGITQYSIPFKVPGSQEERRSLHYFANFAAADLGGYLPSNFWSRTILQRCQHDVPMRHAAAALGRAHLEYTRCSNSSAFAISEDTAEAYRKAIKSLRNHLGRTSEPDRAMVLMCSAIFVCFELVRGEWRVALQHLRSGVGVLREWQDDEASPTSTYLEDGKRELVAAFVRMDIQASAFDDARLPALRLEEDLGPVSPGTDGGDMVLFGSLHEAQESLCCLMHNALVFLVQSNPHKFANAQIVPEAVLLRRMQLVDRLNRWNERLSFFQQQARDQCRSSGIPSNPRKFGDIEKKALSVLMLHWQTIRLLLLHSLQDDVKKSSPSFDDVADEQLRLANEVVHTSMGSGSSENCNTMSARPGERSFSLHLGVVTPMFLLALKTQRPIVRELAVAQLQAAKGRREGFHDAQYLAKLVAQLEKVDDKTGPGDAEVFVNELSDEDDRRGQALEWKVDPILDVRCWDDDEERLEGWERLWTAVA